MLPALWPRSPPASWKIRLSAPSTYASAPLCRGVLSTRARPRPTTDRQGTAVKQHTQFHRSLNVVVQICNAIGAMRMRRKPQVLAASICSISSGSSFNIIPDSVEMRGTMRTFNPEIRDYVVRRIEEITAQIASLYRAESSLEIVSSAPTIFNNDEMVDKVNGYLEDFGMGFESIPNFRLSASDDFGYIARQIPAVMFFLGCKPEGVGRNLLHNPKVVFDEAALPIASALFVHLAVKWLEEHA